MKTRIFEQLDPRQNRMPRDTSRIVKDKPMRQVPLVNPDVMVQNNPAIQRLFADLNPAEPTRIRAESRARLERMVKEANRMIADSVQFKSIHFDVHEESGRFFAVVKDKQSGQVIKQIPSDYLLEMAGRVKRASGLVTDIQA